MLAFREEVNDWSTLEETTDAPVLELLATAVAGAGGSEDDPAGEPVRPELPHRWQDATRAQLSGVGIVFGL